MEEQIPISQMVSQDAPQPSQVSTETASTTYEHLTQAGDHSYSNLLSNLSSTMLLQMMEEGSQAIPSSHGGPLPDSFFISSNRPMVRPLPLTTATKEGKAAAKRKRAPTAPKKAAAKKKTTENKM